MPTSDEQLQEETEQSPSNKVSWLVGGASAAVLCPVLDLAFQWGASGLLVGGLGAGAIGFFCGPHIEEWMRQRGVPVTRLPSYWLSRVDWKRLATPPQMLDQVVDADQPENQQTLEGTLAETGALPVLHPEDGDLGSMPVQIEPGMGFERIMTLYQTGSINEKDALALLAQLVTGQDEGKESHEEEAEGYPDLPPLAIFEPLPKTAVVTRELIHEMEQFLDSVLNGFGVYVSVEPSATMIGPRIICFGVIPTGKPVLVDGTTPSRDGAGRIIYASRTRIKHITEHEKDIQLALAAKTIRILPPVPGTSYVGIEIPNPYPSFVGLASVLSQRSYRQAVERSRLVFALGHDVKGSVRFCDIATAPHLLIAGATGTGKSMLLNTLIASLLTQATPDEVQLLMIDPKKVELTLYNGISHLLAPVVTEAEKACALLENAIAEMGRRYEIFSKLGVRNLSGYRKLREARMAEGSQTLENLPAIVIIIDELADLMMTAKDDVEKHICRLAQLARATGIHLVIATQRPSVDVITGLIKANISTRIALTVSSAVDSRTILDKGGAEKLLGKGDLLYRPEGEAEPIRIQGAFMTDRDAQVLAAYWQREVRPRSSGEHWGALVSTPRETTQEGLQGETGLADLSQHPKPAASNATINHIRQMKAQGFDDQNIAELVGLKKNPDLYQSVITWLEQTGDHHESGVQEDDPLLRESHGHFRQDLERNEAPSEWRNVPTEMIDQNPQKSPKFSGSEGSDAGTFRRSGGHKSASEEGGSAQTDKGRTEALPVGWTPKKVEMLPGFYRALNHLDKALLAVEISQSGRNRDFAREILKKQGLWKEK